jgi:hypothetical protein
MKQLFRLVHAVARQRAIQAIKDAPDGYLARIGEPTRNLDQNAKFHAICGDLERSRFPWAGKARKLEQWKVLLVSGHAVATKEGCEIVPGLESEFVNIRESTASMSVKRSASLIEYAIAFCETHGIEMTDRPAMEGA